MTPPDRFAAILAQTDEHRAAHGCWAYPFRDGPALGVLAAAADPRRILELGTGLGYSACWLAYGARRATLDTVEFDRTHAALARENLLLSGAAERVRLIEGSFEEVLPRLDAGYDIAFVDGHAPSAGQLVRVGELLRNGGLLIAANLDLDGSAPTRDFILSREDWMTAPLLENGRTLVSVVRGQQEN